MCYMLYGQVSEVSWEKRESGRTGSERRLSLVSQPDIRESGARRERRETGGGRAGSSAQSGMRDESCFDSIDQKVVWRFGIIQNFNCERAVQQGLILSCLFVCHKSWNSSFKCSPAHSHIYDIVMTHSWSC